MFKVGDKVKVINPGNRRPMWDTYMSEIFPEYQKYWKYNSETKLSTSKIYLLIGSTATCSLIQDVETKEVFIITTTALELVKEKQFTKSDLKDNHIVVLRDKRKSIWKDFDFKKELNNDLTYSYKNDLDIIEVYEFETLVWKREILDEVEKKYLSDVIRPFRDRVINIIKVDNRIGIYISIRMKGEANIDLPYFKKGTMYKGMEINKEYSLKELGLED